VWLTWWARSWLGARSPQIYLRFPDGTAPFATALNGPFRAACITGGTVEFDLVDITGSNLIISGQSVVDMSMLVYQVRVND
jgi:hypothetical protein